MYDDLRKEGEKVSLKRNCTGIIEIEIQEPLEKIAALEFMFKSKPDHTAPKLLELKFDKNNIPLKEGTDTDINTTLSIKLKPSETYKLTPGTVYMDTRIVLVDNDEPIAEMVVIDGVEDTLFEEVHGDG